MDEDNKRSFEAWESIRDHAWREFQDKARAEWRLSFGIWAALLAAAGALIGTGRTGSGVVPPVIAWIIVGGVVVAHASFLWWVQIKLQSARAYLSEAQEQMRSLLSVSGGKDSRRRIWKQVPMYVELGISILLAGVLIAVFQWWNSG